MNYLSANIINGTFPNSGMGFPMYGTNFIDILFRKLMDDGLQGISLLFLFQLYLYLSIDKIKNASQSINDKIGTAISNFFSDSLFNYFSTFYNKIKTFSFSRLFDYFRENNQISTNYQDDTELVIDLHTGNTTDIMALGNFIYNNNNLNLNNYQRIKTIQNKTIEQYSIPQFLDIFSDDKVTISLQNSIELKIEIETDDISNIYKRCYSENMSETKTESKTIVWNRFPIKHKISFSWPTITYIDDNNYTFCIDPSNLGHFSHLYSILLYKKDFSRISSLFRFMNGEDQFTMDNTSYRLSSSYATFQTTSNIPYLINRLKEAISHVKLETVYSDENKSKVDQIYYDLFLKKNNCQLIFRSSKMDTNKLLNFSRKWMRININDFYQNYRKDGDKINIYQIKINYNVTFNDIPNPEYVAWEEKNDKDDSDKNKNDSDKNDESNKNNTEKSKKKNKYSGWQFAPPRTIRERVETSDVITDLVTTEYKPMEYLYLNEENKKYLLSYLNNFRDNKEIYQKFGFRHRGGILLSGEPGLGKSTTISAVATYLGKDIYYINLGNIRTNNDFKKVLDSIKANSKNGGIIIFEDIDAQTDIVHTRKDKYQNENNLAIVNELNDKLSLSFLLNVIDGTLTPDDMIFIMTTNHEEILDPALVRPGRIDLKIKLEKCTKYQLKNIYQDIYNKPLNPVLLEKFPEYTYTLADIIMHLFHNKFNQDITDEKLLTKYLLS